MNDELKQISLVFCREVLGWENALHSGDGYVISRGETIHADRVWSPEQTNDLNAVLDAVYNWADNLHRSWLMISLKPTTGWQEWQVQFFDVSITRPSLCHALMEASVEADRKVKRLKGSSHKEDI